MDYQPKEHYSGYMLENLPLAQLPEYNNFVEDIFASLSHKKHTTSTEIEIKEFLSLIDIIIQYPNHAKARHGKEKATVLTKWLTDRGVSAQIITVENADPRKTANKDNLWYIVQATARTPNFTGSGVNGILAAHHDEIVPPTLDHNYHYLDGNLHHPWILDDTLQVAAAMMEFVRFQKWLTEQSLYQYNGQVTLLLTDGEEMNTLGMWALLKKWKQEQQLHPISFLILGESTGNSDNTKNPSMPNVAYATRGKITGYCTHSQTESVFDTTLYFLSKFLLTQLYIYQHATETDPTRETLAPTVIASTYGKIESHASKIFWEGRTNKVINTHETFLLLERYLEKSEPFTVDECQHLLSKIKFSRFDISLSPEDQPNSLHLESGKTVHPGSFDPRNHLHAMIGLVWFLCQLTDNEQRSLLSVEFGSENKPNLIPHSAHLVFADDLEISNILDRIKALTPSVEQVATTITKYSAQHFDDFRWQIEADPYIPPRESVSVPPQNWWLVDTARDNLEDKIREYVGLSTGVKISVFNAMNDAGPTTYPEFQDAVWAHGENVLTIGTGNFSTLHGDEYISPQDVLFALVQYRDLLEKLFVTAHQHT